MSEVTGLNFTQTAQLLRAYMERDVATFLWGAPGVGKSAVVRAVAGDLPVIDFRALLRNPVDLMGLPVPNMETLKAVWLPPSELPDEVRDGKEGVLLLDELNAAPPMMQAACYQLTLDRKIGSYALPEGWRVVAAGNRITDRAAAQRMPSALANRFSHIDMQPDADEVADYFDSIGVNYLMGAFLRFRKNLIHVMPASDAREFPSPRTYEQAAKCLDEPNEMLRDRMIAGLIGPTVSEVSAFVRMALKFPSLRSLMLDPEGSELPDNPGLRFAVASGLSLMIDATTFGNITRYLSRMPKEFEAMAVISAQKRQMEAKRKGELTADVSFTHSSDFNAWARHPDNKQIMGIG